MSRRPLLRAPRWTGALLALAALAPGRALAQRAPTLHITDPSRWQAGLLYTAQAGSIVHVSGEVSAASGIRRVLVDGKPARLETDSAAPRRAHFEGSVAAKPGLTEVTIAVEPVTGPGLERRFRLSVVGSPPATVPDVRPATTRPEPPPTTAPSPDTAAAPRQIPELPVILVPRLAHNPWNHYALRGLGYALATGAGAYLTTMKSSHLTEICTGPAGQQDCVDRTDVTHPHAALGLGIAGGAAAIALFDAILTAHRAHAGHASAAEPARARTGLLPPTLEPDARGARIALLRVGF